MANPYQNSFIQGLNQNEIKVIEEHLKKSSNPIEENKELKLFQTLLSNQNKAFSDEELSLITGSKGSAVRVLKSRMFEKTIEALTLDTYIQNDQIFDVNIRVILKLWKKLLILKILQRTSRKSNTAFALELLDQIIAEAKEYEIYDVLIDALIAKKYFHGVRYGITEFNKINSEIDFYYYCVKALYFANDCYYQLIINDGLKKLFSEKELDQYIRSSIKQMKNDFKKTKSLQIHYFLHILQFAYAEQQKDYKKAIHYCNKLLSLLKNNKVIYKQTRIALAHNNLSQYKTFIGKYKEARADIKTAQNFYPENSFDHIIAKEQEFYVNFYDNKNQAALAIVNKLLNHPHIDIGKFRNSKFIFYKACIFFKEKEYKNALKLLSNSMEIEKDKIRWNIALKILCIMITIELKQIDTSSSLLESLRKYMERTGKNEEIKERDKVIVKLLREIEKNGFMVDPSNTAASKMLKELSEKNKPTSWEHYSPELIPFHEWLGPKDSSGGKKK